MGLQELAWPAKEFGLVTDVVARHPPLDWNSAEHFDSISRILNSLKPSVAAFAGHGDKANISKESVIPAIYRNLILSVLDRLPSNRLSLLQLASSIDLKAAQFLKKRKSKCAANECR